jgi:hypothetical protein
MYSFGTRGRRWWLVLIATVLVAALAALWLKSTLEHAVRARIESAAVRHGMVARIAQVHVGLWPLLRLEGFDLDLRPGLRLHADMIAATWPGRLRLTVRAATLTGPAELKVTSPASAWNIAGLRGRDLRLTLVEPQSGLDIRKLTSPVGSTSTACSMCSAMPTRCSMVASRTAASIFRPAPMRSASTWT